MKKTILIKPADCWTIYHDTKTGIAWGADGKTGTGVSIHANIFSGGSVRGMKARGYWAKNARTVRSHGFIYNIDTYICRTEQEQEVAKYCNCIGCQERRAVK